MPPTVAREVHLYRGAESAGMGVPTVKIAALAMISRTIDHILSRRLRERVTEKDLMVREEEGSK